jgi:hypothetical protein
MIRGEINGVIDGAKDMDRDEALNLLKGGVDGVVEWNRRRESGEDIPDLNGADLSGDYLDWADLRWANLREADLTGADLTGADLTGADLRFANLRFANLIVADLVSADLRFANLSEANLSEADLRWAHLSGAILNGAELSGATCSGTGFADLDISEVIGLESIKHQRPSTVGIDTLFRSKGKIPEVFLRGCGVPESVIVQRFALIGAMEPIQFYSCFISYSHKDEDFAQRLHSKMRDKGLRVWFAPEDMEGGKKIHEQIDRAIQVHDRLLLVLSEHSINSKWVRDEIRRARKAEIREARRKLFPIKLMEYDALSQWESFYADLGEDLAEEIREYFIPDFSNWKDSNAFEKAFAKLLDDLKADDPPR